MCLFPNEEKKATMASASEKNSGRRSVKCKSLKVGEGEELSELTKRRPDWLV